MTAQRRAQLLQDVPISVSAFSGEQLESQQIENASDLQIRASWRAEAGAGVPAEPPDPSGGQMAMTAIR